MVIYNRKWTGFSLQEKVYVRDICGTGIGGFKMAIWTGEDGRLFLLHTKDSTYQMFADKHGVRLHTYYG